MFAWFTTEIVIRPDDIDMNRHVHNSRYLDLILAARYDQMERCYRMPMSEFMAHGYGWVNTTTFITHRRPLLLGDTAVVQTRISSFTERGVRVDFTIDRKATGKRAAEGYQDYVMVDASTGRSVRLPSWIIDRYSIQEQEP